MFVTCSTAYRALLCSPLDQAPLTPEKVGTYDPELHDSKSKREEEEVETKKERKGERQGEEQEKDYSPTDTLHPSSEEGGRFNHSSFAVQDNSAMVNLA